MDLDGLCIQAKPLLLIGQELLNILALVALKLDHLAHLRIGNDGAIAGKLFLDDFEDLLLVKFLGEPLHRRQRLTTIALCRALATRALFRHTQEHKGGEREAALTLDTDMDVVLTGILDVAHRVFSLGERVKRLQILYSGCHMCG